MFFCVCGPCFKLNYEALLLAVDLISLQGGVIQISETSFSCHFISSCSGPECCKSCGTKGKDVHDSNSSSQKSSPIKHSR